MDFRLVLREIERISEPPGIFIRIDLFDVIVSLEQKVSVQRRRETVRYWKAIICQHFRFEDSKKYLNLKLMIMESLFDKNLALLNVKNENKQIQELCKKRLMINEDLIAFIVHEVTDKNCFTYKYEVSK